MAEGNGAASVKGHNVILDTCVVTPEPGGMKNYIRSIIPESLANIYLPVMQHEGISPWDLFSFTHVAISFSGGDGYDMVRRSFPIDWDYDDIDDIDTSVIGKYYIKGSFWPAFKGFGFDDTDIFLTIEVRDPTLPCISYIDIREKGGRKYFQLRFWDTYNPPDGSVILWRSDDKGENWYDSTNAVNIEWYGDEIGFYYDMLAEPVWLVLEQVGVGDSNTVILSEMSGIAAGGMGGDRTGTDRNPAGNQPTTLPVDDGVDKGSGKDVDTPPGHGGDNGPSGNEDDNGSSGGGNNPSDSITIVSTVQTGSNNIGISNVTEATVQVTSPVTESAIIDDGESIIPTAADVQLPDTALSLPVVTVQAAPEPGFPVNIVIALLLGTAALCFGAFLVLRLRRG
jgi:hypothetical protein